MKAQNTVQETGIESKSGRVFQYALSTPGKFLLAVAVLISLVSLPLLTKADGPNCQAPEKKALTGTWLVTVTRVNPPPTLPPTFLSLMTYFADGNVLEESNGPTFSSTRRGNWDRIGHQQFTRSLVYFRFDAARTFLGTGHITATLTLSEDGSAFQAEAVIQTFDPSGNPLTTAQSTEAGQRL